MKDTSKIMPIHLACQACTKVLGKIYKWTIEDVTATLADSATFILMAGMVERERQRYVDNLLVIDDDVLWNSAWDNLVRPIVTLDMLHDQKLYLINISQYNLHDGFKIEPQEFLSFLTKNIELMPYINSNIIARLHDDDIWQALARVYQMWVGMAWVFNIWDKPGTMTFLMVKHDTSTQKSRKRRVQEDKCFNCGKIGHISFEFPHKNKFGRYSYYQRQRSYNYINIGQGGFTRKRGNRRGYYNQSSQNQQWFGN